MALPTSPSATGETGLITVRYWAAARSAAGVATDDLAVAGATTLTDVVRRALALHPESGRLPDVLHVCSVLVGDRPASAEDPDDVLVAPGQTVEFLPPFAGG
ncbi:MAG: MoaD/ThiS family protein [Nocardioides sp.]